MPRLGQIMTHLRLVLRMGRATGADIVEAHREGRLSQEDWADMVQTCRGCEWAPDCPEWLDENECVHEAPETCPNRARLAALRDQTQKDD
ncbi:MAG: DUF6455 family protein [Ruegeria sp.]|uniref:DUF6455 family protein n=1 Tax=Ruegeria sp. TaxID=1879320 RepID=UPI00349E8476